MNTRLSLIIFVGFLFFSIGHVSGVYAAGDKKGSLEASPAFTEVVLDKPEATKHVVLTYTNHSTKQLTLALWAIDFKQAEGTGAINFLGVESGSFSYSLSSFLSFEANTLQLAGGETKSFTVSIKNRDDISPGGHYAAVVARVAPDSVSGVDSAADVSPSVSSFILLRKVGGERFHLSLSDVDFPKNAFVFSYPTSITLLFQNEGNVHVVPYGTVEIKDVFGNLQYKGIINTSSLRVFPETRRYIKIDLQKVATVFPVGLHTMTISGQDSLQKTHFSSQSTFLYINPLLLGGLFVVIVISMRLVITRRASLTRMRNKEV